MALSQGNKITIFTTIGAALIGIIGMIAINEYYSPYLRYAEGDIYSAKKSAFTVLQVENTGKKDAENVNISVNFDLPILNITADARSPVIEDLKLGPANLSARFKLGRIVPEQTASIYFEFDSLLGEAKTEHIDYVKQIAFNGGIAKQKESDINLILLIFACVSTVLAMTILEFWKKYSKEKGRIRPKEQTD